MYFFFVSVAKSPELQCLFPTVYMFCANYSPKHSNWIEAGTKHFGFSCHMGRALEGAVFSDYFEWACSVLYYSCGRTNAHDPATHLALVPMQLVSKGLIKQCRGSGPSPSIALLFTALLLPKSLHNCFWLGEKKNPTVKSSYWLPLWGHLPPEERRAQRQLTVKLPVKHCLPPFKRKITQLHPNEAEHISTPITSWREIMLNLSIYTQ